MNMRKSETYRNEISPPLSRRWNDHDREVVDYLSDEYGWSRSVPQSLSGKLKHGSLRYGRSSGGWRTHWGMTLAFVAETGAIIIVGKTYGYIRVSSRDQK